MSQLGLNERFWKEIHTIANYTLLLILKGSDTEAEALRKLSLNCCSSKVCFYGFEKLYISLKLKRKKLKRLALTFTQIDWLAFVFLEAEVVGLPAAGDCAERLRHCGGVYVITHTECLTCRLEPKYKTQQMFQANAKFVIRCFKLTQNPS